jgi:tetratricopeptide (TPR) repeat protein
MMGKSSNQSLKEKIKELISVGYESEELDYKVSLDMGSKKTILELCVDIMAFANTRGGYIITGVSDGDFKPTGLPEDYHVDTAQIQQAISNYLKPVIKFIYAEKFLEIEGSRRKFACLSVDQSDEIVVTHKDGNYAAASGRTKSVFRSGDVFIRKGAMSIKADSDSMRLLVDRISQGKLADITETSKMLADEASTLQLRPMHNLQRPDYREFIGREMYIADILAKLGQRFFVISIDGIGGVGKTALALEIGHRCLDQKLFDAIIWVSAKSKRLILTGIDDIIPSLTSYENLINSIIEVLGYETSVSDPLSEKEKRVSKLLKTAKCLLIIDNLETVEDEQIFDFIINLPEPSKVLITSRRRLGEVERVVRLKEMTFKEAKKLILMDAQDKSVEPLLKATEPVLSDIYKVTGGIPLAIRWIVGWISMGHDVNWICSRVGKSDSPVLEFCFREIYQNLLSPSGREILCLLPIFDHDPSHDELRFVAKMSDEKFEQAIGELVMLSLLNRETKTDQSRIMKTYYSILPLTTSFAQAKLTENRGLEVSARKRLGLYLQRQEKQREAIEQYGYALERVGATTEKGKLAALQAQLAFAAYQRGNYNEATSLFKQAIDVDPNLAYTYQLWGMIERQEGNIGKAEELFREAARLNPTNPIIWRSWAMMKREMRDLDGSEKLLQEGLKHRPSDKASIHSLAVLQSLKGNHEYADRLFRRIYTPHPRNFEDTKNNLYIFAARAENFRKWGEVLEQRLAYDKAREKYKSGLDLLYRGLHFDSQDWNLLKNGIRLHRSLARLESKDGNYELADELFKKGVFYRARNEYQKNHNSIVYFSRALNFVKMKKNEKAIEMCDESLRYADNERALRLKEELTS